MTALSRDSIIRALDSVIEPEQKQSITALGMVSGLQISDSGEVLFMIEVDPQKGPALEPLRQQAEQAVASIKGVGKVTAVLTAQRSTPDQPAPSKAPDPHGIGKIPALNPPIKHIIAVASGKGGVGKSTAAANLAVALAKNKKLKIGLLDADIYGPSQPRMMGLSGKKPKQKNDKIEPLTAHKVKTMSIGFMMDDETPLVWRGPMVQTALIQLFRDVNWGSEQDPLDILIVDMPPGTGDAQLTLAQKIPVAGAIIVSTPQDIALLDARKAIEMFQKTGVPTLGIIENMSTHICSNCGHEEHIFGHGGAKSEAEKRGVPFLGEIPLSLAIRENGDKGKPSALKSDHFDEIAQQIISALAQ